MPAIFPRKKTKTDPPDWQTALIGAAVAVIILGLIIGAAFLWRCLEKREARKAIPQAALTRRWEVTDKAAAKQRKKFEQIQKKKWWSWPWFHECPTQPTSTILYSFDDHGNPTQEITESRPGPQAPPYLPIYVEWADSVQVPEEARTKVSHWDWNQGSIPVRFFAPPAGTHLPAPPKAKEVSNFLDMLRGTKG